MIMINEEEDDDNDDNNMLVYLEEKSVFYRISGPPLLRCVACHVCLEILAFVTFTFCHNVFLHNVNIFLSQSQCFTGKFHPVHVPPKLYSWQNQPTIIHQNIHFQSSS